MDNITVYTDGACRNNQGEFNVGAWGFMLRYKTHEKFGGEVVVDTTNNRMELMGCIKALQAVNNKEIPIEIISDSQYVVKGMNEWILNWIKNKWENSKHKEVENKDLWMQLLSEKIRFADIIFTHCKGHSGNEGNEKVDEFLNSLMDKFERTIDVLCALEN